MIAVPIQISSPERPQSSVCLDYGIKYLLSLEKLVKRYCNTLGSSSSYANLLETSLDIVRWMAVLRDTTLSIISDRKCQYPVSFKSRHNCESLLGLSIIMLIEKNIVHCDVHTINLVRTYS
jgi:hypothetical protein